MPYTQLTLAQFIPQVSSLMDDRSQLYWTAPEIQSAVYEGLQVWAAHTAYWKKRGAVTIGPFSQPFTGPTPSASYIDLSAQFPALRSRTYTLQQMVQRIQWMLLENPGGISGPGMSGQVPVAAILNAIQYARNRFVIDTRLPITYHAQPYASPDGLGMVTFQQTSAYVHRAVWQDIGGAWSPLWRQDSWAVDRGLPLWTTDPGVPYAYSEAENSPLQLQLVPPPIRAGNLEALTVDSLMMNLNASSSIFGIPDEWVHGVTYGALSQLLTNGAQIADPLRAEYAEMRYTQCTAGAALARSVIRGLINGQPANLVPLSEVDAGTYNWVNQYGPCDLLGVLYDIVVPVPGLLSLPTGLSFDMATSAPLPALSDYIQLGDEELGELTNYVMHTLLFKCGGLEFKQSLGLYDSFMKAAANRNFITASKIQYLSAVLGQPQAEWDFRPDRETSNA